MNEHMFLSSLTNKGISLSEDQLKQFETYFEMLTVWNKKMNLTAITDKPSVYEKHFWDSITPLFYTDFSNKKVCDVGAGAGFPSIPMLIVNPSFKLTIVDSLKKRLTFLEELVSELGLNNVELIHGRAEDIAKYKKQREQFDVVTARAVANLSTLSELCLPFSKIGGMFIALKASKADDELNSASKALKILGGKYIKTETLTLPESDEERNLIYIEKLKKTPNKYPRKAGTPAKQPL